MNKNKRLNFKVLTFYFLIFIILIINLMMNVSFSSNHNKEYSVTFYLVDYTNKSYIHHGLVTIEGTCNNKKEFKKEIEIKENKVKLNLEKCEWDLSISIEQEETKGLDYFVRHHIILNKDLVQKIYLFRVGTLKGRVEDSEGNLVSNAKVKIECDTRFLKISTNTDLFGTFYSDIVPEGNCIAYASFQNAAGLKEFNISKGNIKTIVIRLDRKVVSFGIKKYYFLLVPLIILGIILILFIFIKVKRKRKGIEVTYEISDINEMHEEQHKEENETIIPHKLKSIMNTLRPKEKEILVKLLEYHEVSSNKLRKELNIPRTSFFRYIKNLNSKNIINIEKEGKYIKLKINKEYLI